MRFFKWTKVVIVYIKCIFNVLFPLHFPKWAEKHSQLSCHPQCKQVLCRKDTCFLQFECYTKNYSPTVAWWLALKETNLLFQMTNKTKILLVKKYSAILHISKWLLIIKTMSFCSSYLLPFPPPKKSLQKSGLWLAFMFKGRSFLCYNTQRWRRKVMKR